MPICKGCGEEVDELATVRVNGRSRKLCEECAERSEEEDAIASAGEAAMQGMMEYNGRRS